MDMISTDLLILRSIHWIKTEQQMPSAPIYCWFSVDFMYEMPYNAHTQNILMACFNLNDIVNLSLQWSTTLIHIVNKTNGFFISNPGGAMFTFPCGSKTTGVGGQGLWRQHASWWHRRGGDDEDVEGVDEDEDEDQGGHNDGDRQSSYFLIYVDENLGVHFNIDKGWH